MPKRNIVFFCGRLLPPSETFIRTQGEGLQTFTPHYVGSRFVKGLSLPSDRAWVINNGGKIGAAQEALFKLTGIAPALVQKVQKLEPALVHAHFGVCGALALPLVRKLKIPMIVTFYGLDATMKDEYARRESISTRVYVQRREALKRESTLFIAVSGFIKQKLVEQGFPETKILVHYYGVDTKKFQSNPAVQRQPIVLFVGRLTEKKGCEYLIKSMAKVQAILPDVELVIIGDGDLRANLEALAAKLLRRYQFLGLQTSDVVKDWMNRASILAAPSVTATKGDSEGLPTVIVEAQSMGLPVVSTFHAGIPEAVIHGETGFLSEERDSDALGKYTLQLLKDPQQWQRFSIKAREHMEANFDSTTKNKILEGIYQHVLDKEI